MSALNPLITPSLVKGHIVSSDAMHTRAPSCVPRCSSLEATLCLRLRTISPRSGKLSQTSLKTVALIVGGGCRQRPGTKDMGVWSSDNSSLAPIEIAWFARQWAGTKPRLSRGAHYPHPQNRREPPSSRLWARAFSRWVRLLLPACEHRSAPIGRWKIVFIGEEMSRWVKMYAKPARELFQAS